MSENSNQAEGFQGSSEVNALEIIDLRKVLQQFNEDLGQYINAEARFKLGRVLTIIDAAIADPDQRKAIKDLVHNQWWGDPMRPTETVMTDPHSDIRGLCLALGFELYPPSDPPENLPSASDHSEFIARRYKNVLTTRK